MTEDQNIIEEEGKKPKKKKSFLSKLFRIVFYVALTIVGLNVLLYILLSIPFIQNKLVDFTTDKLQSMIKSEVSIDHIRLSLFNHATIKGLYVEDQNKDTLVYAGYLNVKLSPWKLLNNKLQIDDVQLNDFLINVNRKDSVSDFNFQHIMDAFASSDSTQTDTTKSSFEIVIEDVNLKRGRLNYDILSDSETAGVFNSSHISISDFNADLNLYSIDPDNLDVALNNLTAKEKSGLEITTLKTRVRSEGTLFKSDGLTLRLANSRLILKEAKYDLSTDEFTLLTKDVEISPRDIAYFLPDAKSIKDNLVLKADINGKLPLVDARNIEIYLGKDIVLDASAFIANYEDYGNSELKLNIKKLTVSPEGLTSVARLGDPTFVAPDILNDLGTILLKATLDGKLSQFRLKADAAVHQGSLVMTANGGVDTTFNNFDVKAQIGTQNFRLAELIGADSGMGNISLQIDLNALQNAHTPLTANAIGSINEIQYQENFLKNIPFTAFYNNKEMGASLEANLPIGNLIVNASMSQDKIPDIHLDLNIEDLLIDHFYKNKNWNTPKVSFKLNGDIKGLDPDNLIGKVIIDDFTFQDSSFTFSPGSIALEVGRIDEQTKFIDLKSSILSANIKGQYAFTTLGDEFTNLMHDYLSNVFLEKRQIKKAQNNFDITLNVHNTEKLGAIFQLPVDVIKPLTIKGNVNTIDSKIRIEGNIPQLRSGDIDIGNTRFHMVNVDSAFNINVNTNLHIDKLDFALSMKINGADNSIHTFNSLSSKDRDSVIVDVNGDIETMVQFSRTDEDILQTFLQVYSTDVTIGNLVLNLLPARIINVDNRTMINNFGIGINRKKYFGANGVISDQKTDSLNVYFNHAEIGDVLSAFEINHIKAVVNGNIILTNITENIELYTKDLEVKDIVVFSDTLGTLKLLSEWNPALGGVKVDANLLRDQHQRGLINGAVYPAKDSLDMKVNFDRFPVGWVLPFMEGILNKLSGTMSADLLVRGKISEPILSGFLGFNETSVGIDYTNVTYTISDTIEITAERAGFENLILRDGEGNKSIVNANVTHKNFKNLKYSLDVKPDKLLLLNTQSRTDSLFYGKVYASGNVKIEGDDNGINVGMKIKNDKKSTINILIPQTSDATKYKGVVFINVPKEKLTKDTIVDITPVSSIPLNIDAKIEVTPDIALAVVIDPSTGDAMHVKGAGLINFKYDLLSGEMKTFGDYIINEGNVKVSLQGLKTLEFKIRDGSKLSFVGDPLSTKFNITAYRRVKADLKTLDSSFDTEEASPKVLVDCVLGISGNMDKMDLTYSIELPNATDDIQRKVQSLISTDEQKTVQFAYLIGTNTFHSNSGGGGGNITDGMWTSMASGTLSSMLNGVFGNMLGEKWEIGTNIESNDGTFSDVDMSVDVSTRLFNDKLKLHTNVGYNQSATNDNSFIGDFDAEYQLSKNWVLKAYNKTNDQYYTQAPTTQGVGISYTKEANTLKNLFRSFKPRRFRRNNNMTPREGEPAKVNDKEIAPTAGGK